MSYLQFHLVFIIPLIVILLILAQRDLRQAKPLAGYLTENNRLACLAVLIHMIIALVYTTPWDNYLVYLQVWGYPESAVLFRIGYVPFEEYLFFLLQTLLVSLFVYTLARYYKPKPLAVTRPQLLRFIGTGLALLLSAVGLLLLSTDAGTYLGLILLWSGPVLALQWAFGGDLLWQQGRSILLALLIVPYLWLADRIAIGLGIWWISPELTVGIKPLGLPIEEALFFLLTSIFVIFGLSLALNPVSLERAQSWFSPLPKVAWWKGMFVAWALSMIPIPLLPQAFPVLVYISTVLLSLATFGYAWQHYKRQAFLLFAVAFGFGLLVEYIGKTFGVPFGAYSYTAPGPMLLGVPLLVPLGWWSFTLIALAVSPKSFKFWLAPLALVAWDLGLDPLMVDKGFWRFEATGFYYGVPVTNFIGWYLAGLCLVYLLLRLEPRLALQEGGSLRFVFLAQMFLISLGLFFFNMWLAAVMTFIGMGVITLVSFSFTSRAVVSLK